MKTYIAATALALAGTSASAQDVESTFPSSIGQVAPALEAYSTDIASTVWGAEELSVRDRALVTLAALMTRSETAVMGEHIALALDAGVTPAEISEAITHLAFYAGWGSAIAATEAAAPVFEERGISAADLPGADVELLPLNEEQEASRQNMVQSQHGNTSQSTVDYTESYLFRDLWLRPDLAPRDRSLVTVAALVTAGQPDQMPFHLARAMANGLTQEEAGGMLGHLAFYAGWPKVFSALPVAADVFERMSQQAQ
ncbi:MAG: carboxymuconolactone decarboxylase family protein [Pseudomonadota bacterium]|nr:carboxymuconolactone decarboxylase family protein [Pseudomonadota bacterium]